VPSRNRRRAHCLGELGGGWSEVAPQDPRPVRTRHWPGRWVRGRGGGCRGGSGGRGGPAPPGGPRSGRPPGSRRRRWGATRGATVGATWPPARRGHRRWVRRVSQSQPPKPYRSPLPQIESLFRCPWAGRFIFFAVPSVSAMMPSRAPQKPQERGGGCVGVHIQHVWAVLHALLLDPLKFLWFQKGCGNFLLLC